MVLDWNEPYTWYWAAGGAAALFTVFLGVTTVVLQWCQVRLTNRLVQQLDTSLRLSRMEQALARPSGLAYNQLAAAALMGRLPPAKGADGYAAENECCLTGPGPNEVSRVAG